MIKTDKITILKKMKDMNRSLNGFRLVSDN